MSIAMRGTDSAQVAAAAAEYLPGGQTRRDGKETWIIDDCLGRMWDAIGSIDDIDAMFKQRIDRCVLISPLLAYEDMDDILRLMGEVCSATEWKREAIAPFQWLCRPSRIIVRSRSTNIPVMRSRESEEDSA